MAMGLDESTGTFNEMMKLALAGLQGKDLEVFIDDIYIFAETLDEHCASFNASCDD